MILRAVLAVAYATGRASHARQVKGDDPDKKGYPGPPGWGFGVGLTTPHSKKLVVTKFEERNNLDRFNDDGLKRTRYTEITLTTWNMREVERDLQVLGVRRWRELVIDRDKRERYCSKGQSPQRAVATTEEEGFGRPHAHHQELDNCSIAPSGFTFGAW